MTSSSNAATRAAIAAPSWAAVPPADRARILRAMAVALEDARTDLIEIARTETGLSQPRLEGELTRTIVQLRLFSDVVASGEDLDVRIDEADPDFILGPRPDLRRYRVPLGPVLNFSASNFPFAFSVAGGDTASALAAGCPVIVKAHSGHPRLSDRTGQVAAAALELAGAPAGVLQVVHGQDLGVELLSHPAIRAGSFTGSTGIGRMLADVAAARPAPIPFYGELGSVNPVFITERALVERAEDIASGLATSISGSAGQLCTKPGYVFVPEHYPLHALVASALSEIPEHRLLTRSISTGYTESRERLVSDSKPVHDGASRVDDDGFSWVTPTVVSIPAARLRARPELIEEVFGPFAVLVEYTRDEDLVALARDLFEGSLTVTVHADEGEDVRALLDWGSSHAGRVIMNGWPTGVSVTYAQQHGGPWPATTLDTSTSVGTAAIGRFQRAVAYQSVPDELLPAPLQDANPWGVPQRRAPAGESTSWGTP